MNDTVRRAPPLTLTMWFTRSEVRQIEQASKLCSWKAAESAEFVRNLLLRNVDAILLETHSRPRISKLTRRNKSAALGNARS